MAAVELCRGPRSAPNCCLQSLCVAFGDEHSSVAPGFRERAGAVPDHDSTAGLDGHPTELRDPACLVRLGTSTRSMRRYGRRHRSRLPRQELDAIPHSQPLRLRRSQLRERSLTDDEQPRRPLPMQRGEDSRIQHALLGDEAPDQAKHQLRLVEALLSRCQQVAVHAERENPYRTPWLFHWLATLAGWRLQG